MRRRSFEPWRFEPNTSINTKLRSMVANTVEELITSNDQDVKHVKHFSVGTSADNWKLPSLSLSYAHTSSFPDVGVCPCHPQVYLAPHSSPPTFTFSRLTSEREVMKTPCFLSSRESGSPSGNTRYYVTHRTTTTRRYWQTGSRRCPEFAPSVRRVPRTRFTFRWGRGPDRRTLRKESV